METKSLRAALMVAVLTAVGCNRFTLRPPDTVRVLKDMRYCEGEDADPTYHRLDLYLPADAGGVPVVVFIHGGGWTGGSRQKSRYVGWVLASEGIATAVVDYRLSPAVKHPAHVEDAARAFAWVHEHIEEYGPRRDRVFLMGHSAGAHLAALLALDERYLRKHGLSPSDVRGAVLVSGVYRISDSIRWGTLRRVFPTDAQVLRDASPMNHARRDAPPTRLLYASADLPGLAAQARDLHAVLVEKGACVDLIRVTPRGHMSILEGIVRQDDDVRGYVLDFVRNYSQWPVRRSGPRP